MPSQVQRWIYQEDRWGLPPGGIADRIEGQKNQLGGRTWTHTNSSHGFWYS